MWQPNVWLGCSKLSPSRSITDTGRSSEANLATQVVAEVQVDSSLENLALDSASGSPLEQARSRAKPKVAKRRFMAPPSPRIGSGRGQLAFLVREWIECLGPVTVAELAERLGLSLAVVQIALATLSRSGVLRGQFRQKPALPGSKQQFPPPRAGASQNVPAWQECASPAPRRRLRTFRLAGSLASSQADPNTEWCERRILARIHRLTLGRLRQEIEPASTTDFIRFLLHWQHLEPGTQLHGREGLLRVLEQLQGLELPATAWERDILPKRIANYRPEDLEALCLSGMVAWGRLRLTSPPSLNEETASNGAIHHRSKPSRSAPLAFFTRQAASWLLDLGPASMEEIPGLSPVALEVANTMRQWGACFLSDISKGTGRLAAEVEDALWELVSRGLVTGDGMAGLRVLLLPLQKRRGPEHRLRVIRGGSAPGRLLPLGRWSLLHPQRLHQPGSLPNEPTHPDDSGSAVVAASQDPGEFETRMAAQLLRRYGIVIRELLTRESHAPNWRTLLRVYRKMEARGEIRGGRFVNAFAGEQFALPEAVETLRALRRGPKQRSGTVLVSSADPLNLVGILTPGARVSPFSHQWIAVQDGLPVEVGPLGNVLSRLQAKQPSGTESTEPKSSRGSSANRPLR